MLVIREAQMAAFRAARLEELRAWLHPHLRKHLGHRLKDTDDVALAALIEATVTRALEYGATRSQAICKFVHIRVLFGEGFDRLPWAVEALRGPGIDDSDTRIEVLYLRARFELASMGDAR
jgi:hypothetical protein